MKQKVILIFAILLAAAALIGLNALSTSQKPKEVDSELRPNRSSYNAGATGTRAFYALLSESGRKVTRWQESYDGLSSRHAPSVLVVVGPVRVETTPSEDNKLFNWVAAGGRLVIFDRYPPPNWLVTTGFWRIASDGSKAELDGMTRLDAFDQRQMIGDQPALKPSQPSIYTAGVSAVQPSRLATSINFYRNAGAEPDEYAPVVHVGDGGRNLVVDASYGAGKIVWVADPFIVANNGISAADNAQLAINLVSTTGTVAIDEYRQGIGSGGARIVEFFAGTPVVSVFFQCVFLAFAYFASRSVRFARAVPEAEPDRLSKLEYVSAMADLQYRTRAYDLAIENIYRDLRRRASKLFGVDNNTTSRVELARLIARRSGLDAESIEQLFFECEEIMHGEPSNAKRVTRLTSALRNIESKLGISRRSDN